MSNLEAFLQMIGVSEGTVQIPGGEDGYKVIVGSTPKHPILFDSYDDHPRRLIRLSPTLVSTAAGKFQILERYFDAYKESLHLLDFSPLSQDAIATQMIREQHALEDVNAGRFDIAIAKCANIWASLAGSNYGQPTRTMEFLTNAYKAAGGTLA